MKTPLGGCRGEFVLVIFRNDVFFFVKYDVITGGDDVFFGEEYYFKFRVGEFFLFHITLRYFAAYATAAV